MSSNDADVKIDFDDLTKLCSLHLSGRSCIAGLTQLLTPGSSFSTIAAAQLYLLENLDVTGGSHAGLADHLEIGRLDRKHNFQPPELS